MPGAGAGRRHRRHSAGATGCRNQTHCAGHYQPNDGLAGAGSPDKRSNVLATIAFSYTESVLELIYYLDLLLYSGQVSNGTGRGNTRVAAASILGYCRQSAYYERRAWPRGSAVKGAW